MKDYLICGELIKITNNINTLYGFHLSKKINIVGISACEQYYDNIFGFSYYSFNDINKIKYDYIILVCNQEDFINYRKYILSIDNEAKIINYKVFNIPCFNIDKYLSILSNTPSIFANNCSAGVIYNTLGLEFKSPLINLWINDEDYIKFLKEPKKYLSSKIEKNGYGLNLVDEKIPVCKVNDISINCSHYKTHKDAIKSWNRRKSRVDYDNILVLFISNNENYINEFLNLPYSNIICITELKINNPNVVTIDYASDDTIEWILLILNTFKYEIPYINVIDLLHDKKITYISKMNIKNK